MFNERYKAEINGLRASERFKEKTKKALRAELDHTQKTKKEKFALGKMAAAAALLCVILAGALAIAPHLFTGPQEQVQPPPDTPVDPAPDAPSLPDLLAAFQHRRRFAPQLHHRVFPPGEGNYYQYTEQVSWQGS